MIMRLIESCLPRIIIRYCYLILTLAVIANCSSAPTGPAKSRISLHAEDSDNDMEAKVIKITRSDGSGVTITALDYENNFVSVLSGRYTVMVQCTRESNGGIYKNGTSSGTFDLAPDELLQVEFMRGEALVSNKDCPLLFSTNL